MFKKIISDGQMYPTLYGVAYYDYLKRQAVCYPVPFNLVARLTREVYGWLRNPWGFPSSEELRRHYHDGFQDGLKHGEMIGHARGYQEGKEAAFGDLEKAVSERWPSTPTSLEL